MPRAVECICCSKLSEVEECLEGSDRCVKCLETFKTLCLDKDVLYTVLVTRQTVRGDKVETLIIRHFMQEHQEVLHSLSVKLAWLLVSLLSLSSLLLQRLSGSNLYGNIMSLSATMLLSVISYHVLHT